MLVEDAMSSHLIWKLHLEHALAGAEPLNPGLTSTVARDVDQCSLGRWIADKAPRYEGIAEFDALMLAHAEFHAEAAAVLEKIEAGDACGARVLMGGPFQAASRRIINALYGMKKREAEAAPA
ncbi:MAG TPA: CZB domain-containing protein [Rhodocyclaceae bacterium]